MEMRAVSSSRDRRDPAARIPARPSTRWPAAPARPPGRPASDLAIGQQQAVLLDAQQRGGAAYGPWRAPARRQRHRRSAIMAWRLANPPMPWLTNAVSPARTWTACAATPKCAAHSCARVVAMPCPSQRAGIDRNLSGRRDTDLADSNGPRPVGLTPLARPMPHRPRAAAACAHRIPHSRSRPARACRAGKIAAVDRERHPGPGLQRLDIGSGPPESGCAGGIPRGRCPRPARSVQHAFHHECRLRIAAPPHGGHRHLVGMDHAQPQAAGRHQVRTGQDDAELYGTFVPAAYRRVVMPSRRARQDLAARVGGELHTPILIALLDRAENVAPVLHPFDRPAQLARATAGTTISSG